LEKLSGGVDTGGRIGWGKLVMTSSTVEYFSLMLEGPECLVAVLEKKLFSVRRPKKMVVLLASYSVL
jgi:hypothetical protein